MKIIEINNYDELLNYEKSWKELLCKCQHSVFSTWEWITIWWKHFGDEKKLLVLIAEENGKILGIAPLMVSVNELFHVRKGSIQFIGTPQTDYQNFIIGERKEECLESFVEYINNIDDSWDSIELREIPQDTENLPLLSNFSKNIKPMEYCPFITLPSSMSYFMENLSYKKRKYVRAGLRKLHSNFEVEFGDYSTEEKFADGMKNLITLHQKKWKSIGQCGVFNDKKTIDFHNHIAATFSKRKWLSLHVLKLSGVPVAAEYGFDYNSRYYAYLPGLDPTYLRYSVGNMLFILIVEELIRKGISTYDFLRGAEEYKLYWNATSKLNYQVIINKHGYLEKAKHWWISSYWFVGSKFQGMVTQLTNI